MLLTIALDVSVLVSIFVAYFNTEHLKINGAPINGASRPLLLWVSGLTLARSCAAMESWEQSTRGVRLASDSGKTWRGDGSEKVINQESR
jgi:hypothetical protein